MRIVKDNQTFAVRPFVFDNTVINLSKGKLITMKNMKNAPGECNKAMKIRACRMDATIGC